MASYHIPGEVLFEILKRLPVKTLIRFLCVSKSWNSLISSPSFSKSHQIRLNDVVVVEGPTYLRVEQCIMLHRQDNTKTQLTLPLPPKFDLGVHVTILSVIHGVVFFAYTDHRYLTASPRFIAFWNPIIKRHVSAPLPPDESGPGGRRLLGAGFDASKKDFKAVLITYSKKPAACCRYYEVFSASAGAWKKREWTTTTATPPPKYYNGGNVTEIVSGGCCYFNGAIYWNRGMPDGGLVLFDCSSEEFKKMEVPEQVWDSFGRPRVFMHRGLLSVIARESGINMSTKCGLLTMKEYGVWTKDLIFTYSSSFLEGPRRWRRYDSMEYEDVDIHMIGTTAYVFQESILLLDIGNACPDV